MECKKILRLNQSVSICRDLFGFIAFILSLLGVLFPVLKVAVSIFVGLAKSSLEVQYHISNYCPLQMTCYIENLE